VHREHAIAVLAQAAKGGLIIMIQAARKEGSLVFYTGMEIPVAERLMARWPIRNVIPVMGVRDFDPWREINRITRQDARDGAMRCPDLPKVL
jgi:hypothetical protein